MKPAPLLIADVSFSTEAMAIIGAMGTGLVGTIAMLFKQLMASKEKQLVDMTSARDSFKEMANESVSNLEVIANRGREQRGEPPFKLIAPVVPEHQSPVKEAQKQTAELQSLRARLVAATLNLELPAREVARLATEAEEK